MTALQRKYKTFLVIHFAYIIIAIIVLLLGIFTENEALAISGGFLFIPLVPLAISGKKRRDKILQKNKNK